MSTILIIDDMIQTLKYLSLYLSKDGFDVKTAKSYQDGLAVLEEENIDLILLDVMMPDVDGFESCKRLKKDERFAAIPVIFVTSCDSGDAISQCFDAGGVDYVYKFATQRELLARVKTQLRLSETQNSEQRALMRFSKALDVFPNEILTVDVHGRIIFMNASMRELHGSQVKLLSDMDESIARMMGADIINEVLSKKEPLEIKKTFGNVTREITMVPVIDDRVNESEFLFIVSRDVTELEEMEFHLRQSKKMESVSMIAGGAAHDLNNILGGMLGYTSMARMHSDNKLSEEFIIKAESAAEKAAAVISQLLNFARQKEPKVENVPVRALVNEAVKLLSTLLQKKKRISIDETQEDYVIRVDNYLVQQALVNVLMALEKNMDDTGHIRITMSSTFNRDTLLPFREDDMIGDFVKIIVVDDEEYDQLLDKPINLDKNEDRNVVAGLGVAIVNGIVKDFGGMFYIHGDTQKPTGFTLCFPVVFVEEAELEKEEEVPEKSGARILIVDNEVLFVQMVNDLMDLLDHNATFCDNGRECLDVYLKKSKDFDVLMLDYGEKEMLPVEIMEQFSKANPDLKILLTSSKQVEEVSMIADLQGCSFIEKPFKMKHFSDLLVKLLAD
jgi:two-component system cell cycle sensor histidine kinase/response regulator CckA